jgi:uncharacterized protein
MIRRFLVVACALVSTRPLTAQSTDATFYLVVGRDTIMVERQSRTASRFDGEFVDRVRRGHMTFGATVAAEGLVTRLEEHFVPGAGDTVVQSQTIVFAGDSIILDRNGVVTRTGGRAGALPYINPSPTFMEQILLRARSLGGSSATVPLFLPGAPPVPAAVAWIGSDSATVTVGGATLRFAVDARGHVLGGSMPAQGLKIIRGAPIGPLANERPNYAAPPDAPYSAEDVTFKNEKAGISLAGTLTIPKNASGRVPAIVTLTGSGQQERDEALLGITGYRLFRQVADTLGRRGIAVLRIDDRGVGGSGGNAALETSADYADDIRAAVAYLRSRPEVDPARIGLVGHSEGGIVAPMVAADDSTIAGIVLLAGTSRPGRRILEYQFEYQLNRAKMSGAGRDSIRRQIPARLDSMATIPWARYFMQYDPSATAKRVRVPVLIMQGEGDIQVTPDQAAELEAAFRAGGNSRVTVRMFPKTNHLFLLDTKGETDYASLPSKQVPPNILGTIADWLANTLRVRP